MNSAASNRIHSFRTLIIILGGLILGTVIGILIQFSSGDFIILILLFTLLMLMARLFRISLPVVIICTGIVAELFLGDLDIGSFSLRVYTFGSLLIYSIVDSLLRHRPLFACKEAFYVGIIYSVFILWTFLAALGGGSNLPATFNTAMTRHTLALAAFVVIQYFVRTKRDNSWLIWTLVLSILLSSIIAILQWLGNSLTWDIWFKLHPLITNYYNVEAGILEEYQLVPGLAATAFTMGYQLVTLGPFLLAFSFLKNRSIYGSLGLLIIIAGLMVVQQRSSLLGFIVILVIGFLMFIRTQSKISMRITLFLIISFFGYFLIRPITAGNTPQGQYSLDRFDVPVDEGRIALARAAFEFANRNWMFGGGAENFIDSLQTANDPLMVYTTSTTHNVFLNALIYYGIPALLIIIILIIYIIQQMGRIWLMTPKKNDWILLGIEFGLIGYLVNTQFHNASFVTGDVLPWILLALLFIYDRMKKIDLMEQPNDE
jgi:hypothetical protein